MGPSNSKDASYWITAVKSDKEWGAQEVIQNYVGLERVYAFGERTPGRGKIKPGDWICFYASQTGVVAHARIISSLEKRADSAIRNPEAYPWVFDLDGVEIYLDHPIVIDSSLRLTLDAFKDKDPDKRWAWFVQSTRKISQRDFERLTSQSRF